MLQILFAVLAGILTAGAPCILPLLPILLGTSVGRVSKWRPLLIVVGFTGTFSVLGIFLFFLTTHLGLNPNTLRVVAISLLVIFGLLLIWPKPFELLSMRLNGLVNRTSQVGKKQRGNWGGLLLGMTLGVIWTPCAGPVLGVILSLVATQNNLGQAAALLFAYAVGAGLPMLIIAYGSQYVTTKVRVISKYTVRLQQIFGVLIILLAVAIYKNYDVVIENQLAGLFPSTAALEAQLTQNFNPKIDQTGNSSTKISLGNFGAAPDFTGISHWLNSGPLTISSLKGKVVLVDFWTYSCINCIRTLPFVTKWYDTYKDQGLVVVGVHTPEFAFEQDTNNVAEAIKRFNINYPVAQDNSYATWQAYSNLYWPAEYLIDQQGKIVYTHFGEGEYDRMENAIRQLLGLSADIPANNGQDLSKVASPEMYFGTERQQNLTSQQSSSAMPKFYNSPGQLDLNKFSVDGNWQFSPDRASLVSGAGKIKLHFSAAKVYLVAQSTGQPISLKIIVDGKLQPSVTIGASQLYRLFDSNDYSEHQLEIDIPAANFEAFTFTFG